MTHLKDLLGQSVSDSLWNQDARSYVYQPDPSQLEQANLIAVWSNNHQIHALLKVIIEQPSSLWLQNGLWSGFWCHSQSISLLWLCGLCRSWKGCALEQDFQLHQVQRQLFKAVIRQFITTMPSLSNFYLLLSASSVMLWRSCSSPTMPKIINEWLSQLGLSQSPAKHVSPIPLTEYEGMWEFNFLLDLIIAISNRKTPRQWNTKEKNLGFKTLITPNQEGISGVSRS